jgi:hypothetical protein
MPLASSHIADQHGDHHVAVPQPRVFPRRHTASDRKLPRLAVKLRVFGATPGMPPLSVTEKKGHAAVSTTETGQTTGTKDKDYNLIWFTEACLSNALRLDTYIQDAEREGDNDLAEFFRRAQAESRKGAEQAKQMLARRLSG